MLVGVGLFGLLTASVAAYFVESSREPAPSDEVLEELRRIRELLEPPPATRTGRLTFSTVVSARSEGGPR